MDFCAENNEKIVADVEKSTFDVGFDESEYEKQNRIIIKRLAEEGVIFASTSGVYIGANVKIGKGTIVYENNRIDGKTVIGTECIIKRGNLIENSTLGREVAVSESRLSECKIGANTSIGPYANVHSGSVVGKNCRIGNFVEIKNSTLGIATKAAHLCYIGDADIGNQCNVGCGAIFVNYDGKNKHRSIVGDSVFIGSNSNVIAPVKIASNAYIAAGTTVTIDLPENCLCIGRARETVKDNKSKYVKNVFEKKYFGTDGIRGIYPDTLDENLAYKVGNCLGYSADGGKIVIGRDTRESGINIAKALCAGITDAGTSVVDIGVATTPLVNFTAKNLGANFGIVVSASHNPPEYNGIKIFNFDGRKLYDIEEDEIEKFVDGGSRHCATQKGIVEEKRKCAEEYVQYVVDIVSNRTSPATSQKPFEGLKIVLDTANGAAEKIAPLIFEKLGAQVVLLGAESTGKNINCGCGALHPEVAAKAVIENDADAGFAFDGDADRVIAIGKGGVVLDGDDIMFEIALNLEGRDKLNRHAIVGTVMTNSGVEKSLEENGIALVRTAVGDHNVTSKMVAEKLTLGGETSGHVILGEYANTGDGVLVAAVLCNIAKENGSPLAKNPKCKHYPQVQIDVETQNKDEIVKNTALKNEIASIEQSLGGGRIVVRASGTEQKIRIMAEAENENDAKTAANKIKDFVVKTSAQGDK